MDDNTDSLGPWMTGWLLFTVLAGAITLIRWMVG